MAWESISATIQRDTVTGDIRIIVNGQISVLSGSDGKSAYEIALENGFVGTEEEWIQSLVGETGAPGPIGETGAQGPQGPQGVQGIPGPVNIASDAEMIAGLDDTKAATPLKIKNWFEDAKGKPQTFSEVVSFAKQPKLPNFAPNCILSLDANRNVEDILRKTVPTVPTNAIKNPIELESNWNNANVYTGPALTGAEQLWVHADTRYFYFFYDSTTPVRMSRNSILHLIGNSGTPSISAGAAAGTAPTISISGTDLGFKVVLTIGTSPTTGVLATVTFNRPYGSAPIIPEPGAGNANTIGVRIWTASTTTTMTLNAATALTAGTQYIWNFIIVQ